VFLIIFSLDHITCFHNIWATYLRKKKIFLTLDYFLLKNVRNKIMIMLFVIPISVIAPRLQLFFWYFLNQVIMWELWACWVVKLKTWQNFKKNWNFYFEILGTSMQSTPTITKYIIGKWWFFSSPSHDESCEYESFMISSMLQFALIAFSLGLCKIISPWNHIYELI